MKLTKYKKQIPAKLYKLLESRGFEELRPSQIKSIKAGLFEDKNLLVCTPTGSGKTLVGELAILDAIYKNVGKAVYIVPLKALANEKYREFKARYPDLKIAISIGDIDSPEFHLAKYDVIICTSEKLDSLLRHQAPWLKDLKVVIVDEIHLITDPNRGPTLEILLTILRTLLKDIQIIGLSATIGNPKELAEWLDAELVLDKWRPVKLEQGVHLDGQIEFV
ncbi:DEAD/DEAH box helicase [Candidatus Woesearchaeota archaeon]|jgi:helicase|nr:DEAD/DEAH box helicase [Candidatus Woesearchaeota archaeon]MBT5272093.1 DEAD/DEAH box helicase [Candidatus Woesearchaeota archaeon]MBT6041843.1 DEAD/DEAH box helicase [Candidatus Woesearchaeota archaeon]MBT6336782.1 DEAD/DEAH box helicase [Candidatus Woesearchaeota archaeon]MBT7927683.1 DEAD/DEAH box helicase [Candidatus Woesearchaeota archaeon]